MTALALFFAAVFALGLADVVRARLALKRAGERNGKKRERVRTMASYEVYYGLYCRVFATAVSGKHLDDGIVFSGNSSEPAQNLVVALASYDAHEPVVLRSLGNFAQSVGAMLDNDTSRTAKDLSEGE